MAPLEFIRPLLGSMQYPQHPHRVPLDLIGGEIRRLLDNKLTRADYATWPAALRKRRQLIHLASI